MEAAQAQHDYAIPDRTRLHVLPDGDSRVQSELAGQLDTAVAFADFCTFLTAGKVSDQADQLVSLAQALYVETADHVRQSSD